MQSAFDRRPVRTPSQHHGAAPQCAPEFRTSFATATQPPALPGPASQARDRQSSAFPRSSSIGSGGNPSSASKATYERSSSGKFRAVGTGAGDLGARLAAAVATTASSAAAGTAPPPIVSTATAEVHAAEAAAQAAAEEAAAQRNAKARELLERLRQPTAHETRERERREKARADALERQRREQQRQQELVTRAAMIVVTAGMPGGGGMSAEEARAEQERLEQKQREAEQREQEAREAEERQQREEEERRRREEQERRHQLKSRAAAIVASAPTWEKTLQQQLQRQQEQQKEATVGLPQLPSPAANSNLSRGNGMESSSRRPAVMLQIDVDATDCNVVTVAATASTGGYSRAQGAAGSERIPRPAPTLAAKRPGGKSPRSNGATAEFRSFGPPAGPPTAVPSRVSSFGAPPPALLPPKSPARAPTGAMGKFDFSGTAKFAANCGADAPDASILFPEGSGGRRFAQSFQGQREIPVGQQQRDPSGRKSAQSVKKSVSFPDLEFFHPPNVPAEKADRGGPALNGAISGSSNVSATYRFGAPDGFGAGVDAVKMDAAESGAVGVGACNLGSERRARRAASEGEGGNVLVWNEIEDDDDVPVANGWDWNREISLSDVLDDTYDTSASSTLRINPPLLSLPLSPTSTQAQSGQRDTPNPPFPHSPAFHTLSPHSPLSHSPSPHSTSPHPTHYTSASIAVAPASGRRKDSLPPLSPSPPPPNLPPAVPPSQARRVFPRSTSSGEAEASAYHSTAGEPENSPGWGDGVERRARTVDAQVGGLGRNSIAEPEDSPGSDSGLASRQRRVDAQTGGPARTFAAEPEGSPSERDFRVRQARSDEDRITVRARTCATEPEDSRRESNTRERRARTADHQIGDRGSGGGGGAESTREARGVREVGGGVRETRGVGSRGGSMREVANHRGHSKSMDAAAGAAAILSGNCGTDSTASRPSNAACGEGKGRAGRSLRKGSSPGDTAGSGSERAAPGDTGVHRRSASWAVEREAPSSAAEARKKAAQSPRNATGGSFRESKVSASATAAATARGAGNPSVGAGSDGGEAEADDSSRWEEARTLFFGSHRGRRVNLAVKGAAKSISSGLSSFSKLVAAAGTAAAASVGIGVGGVGVDVLGRGFGELDERFEVESGKELGAGQFGVTRVVTCTRTGKRFACKTVDKAALKSKSDLENVRREVTILELLKAHPNVIQLEEAIEDRQSIHLIMELCSGGELFTRIKERRRYGEKEAAQVMQAVLEVLQFCHRRHHLLHRDIKPENILLVAPSSHTEIRVIDFGVAVFHKPGAKPLSDTVGSIFYVAPEVLAGSYGMPADVWSAGVVLYVLLAGVPPFWSKTEAGIAKAIREEEVGFKGSAWRGVSDEAKDLIRRMLDRDQKKRVSAEEALDHSWFKRCLVLDVSASSDSSI